MTTQKPVFKPHVSGKKKVPEFTFKSLSLGIILGFFFAIGNAYLGLKIGTTISASIPAAVVSMGVFKVFFRKSTILEHNIVQTIATVGEGLAAGIIFTIPALMLLGDAPSIGRIFLLSVLGGILGVLFMIPMRRYIIVEEHGVLPFPEGTACAEILKVGEKGHKSAIMALWGLLLGSLFKICSGIFGLWTEKFTWILHPFEKSNFSVATTPSLLGVGFIVGPKITSIMFSGGVFAWWVIIPLMKMFGGSESIIYPSTIPISDMSSQEIWASYVRYIGAGAVATGGFLSLIKIWPLIIKTVHVGVKELFSGFGNKQLLDRTDQDISLAWLILGSIAIILTLWLFPGLPMNLTTIILLVIIGFFFVAVTSITVGIVGSTSNPVSGMTITTLLLTCIIFVLLGWTERVYLIAAITMAAVANIAICMAATTSQDLKTGFLLGSTPKLQQIAEIIGVFVPSLALGFTVYILNEAYQLGSESMPAPQATLMALITKGVISGDLPYTLIIVGVIIGLLVEILKVPVLPFAIGLYLPLSLSAGIMVGGLISWYVNRHSKKEEAQEKGILLSSGLVGGDACIGILIAFLTVIGAIAPEPTILTPSFIGLLAYLLLAGTIGALALSKPRKS
ncbi:MAG: oligopeptide transporter, OPT family [Chlamydiota bacterium]|jgi:putative OPT family oligopeptide transporter